MQELQELIETARYVADLNNGICLHSPEGYWGIGLCAGCDKELGDGHGTNCPVERLGKAAEAAAKTA